MLLSSDALYEIGLTALLFTAFLSLQFLMKMYVIE